MAAANDCPHWREAEALRFPPSSHQNGEAAVVIVGAGPVGLTLAIDLAQRGVPTVVIDKRTALPDGSRAICWSRRSLDIFNRIGIAETMRAVGAQWQLGRVYHKQAEIYSQRLTPETFPENPFFVNFQQSLCEYLLVEAAKRYPAIDLRWHNELSDIRQPQDGGAVTLRVRCADGDYDLRARYVAACDGAKSLVRNKLGLSFAGRKFQDRFLIADIEMRGDFPAERRFWFEPPFHDGQSTLLHKQAQDIWRVDFQLDTDDNISKEQLQADKESVRRRIRAFLGRDDLSFEVVWSSVYFFTCQRIEKFRHGNIFFAGDSAHVVSPFGARGGNSGIEDANNLGWKLAEVLHNRADEELLNSYDDERIPACDDNILNSSRTTNFMTPKSAASKRIRDTVLALARRYDFAKRLVNAGRMSTPFSYHNIGMFRHRPQGIGRVCPGDVGVDVPLAHQNGGGDYLLRHIRDYTLLAYKRAVNPGAQRGAPPCDIIRVDGDGSDWRDAQGLMAQYYFDEAGGYALFRPDQYMLGVCDDATPQALLALLQKYRRDASSAGV